MTNFKALPKTDRQQFWNLEKPAARGTGGIVSSHHIAASEVGANVLRQGGNAIDAAIATSIAISVLEPWMSGIGGGSYLTHYSASDKKVRTLHFGMKSPKNLNIEDFKLADDGEGGDLFAWPAVKGDTNVSGWKAIGVPGHLAGLDYAHKKWATWKWADLINPSIALAQKGLPITWSTSLRIATGALELRKDPTAASIYLRDGLPPVGVAGRSIEYLPLGALSKTLQTIGEDGVGTFYDGQLGRSIVADIQAGGGYFSHEDLSSYTVDEEDAVTFERGGKTIHTTGGLTAGPSMKCAFENLPEMEGAGHPSAKDVAAWAQAIRNSYETRFETMGDLDADRDPSCTTHLTVVDSDGNMVSLTQTLLSIFGAKVMLPSSGVLMNNGIMWFDPRPGRPNSLAPNKRPLSNMAPTVLTNEDGSPFAALGASGGRRIFPALLQIISMMTDFKMNIEEALHAPRIDVSGLTGSTVDPAFEQDVFDAVNSVLPATLLEHAVMPAHYALPSGIGYWEGEAIGCVEPSTPIGAAVAV
jgi:gamma-glutamyltranspeptidase / glutathione hydrolase